MSSNQALARATQQVATELGNSTQRESVAVETTLWVETLNSVLSDISNNTTVSSEARIETVALFTDHIAAIGSIMGEEEVTSADLAYSLTDSLLGSARSLVTVRSSANSSSTVTQFIPIPSKTNIPGGFVQAVNGSDNVISYPYVGQNVTSANLVSGFSINIAAVPHNSATELAVAIIEFSDDNLFPATATARGAIHPTSQRIGSSVLSASLGVPVHDLSDDDRVCGTYMYTANLKNDPTWHGSVGVYDRLKSPPFASPKCVYYNHTQREWSKNGCAMVFLNNSHATCCCNHLTSFAVLVGGDEVSEEDALGLSVLTQVGLTASLLSLSLCIVVITLTPSLINTLRYRVLLQLILALAGAQFIFCFITVPTSTESCKTVSFMLLYFLAAFFCWMNVEAWQLFRTFVNADVWNVEGSYAATHKLLQYSAFAWGLPILLVLCAMWDSDGMITTADVRVNDVVVGSSISYCWFDIDSAVKWVVLIPMLCSLSFNCLISAIVWKRVRSQLHRKRDRENSGTQNRAADAVAGVKLMIIVASATGIGWALAVFVLLGIGGVAGQYIFTITNAFQGCLIFYCHIYLKEDGRRFFWTFRKLVSQSIMSSSKKNRVVRRVHDKHRSTVSGPSSEIVYWRRQTKTAHTGTKSDLDSSVRKLGTRSSLSDVPRVRRVNFDNTTVEVHFESELPPSQEVIMSESVIGEARRRHDDVVKCRDYDIDLSSPDPCEEGSFGSPTSDLPSDNDSLRDSLSSCDYQKEPKSSNPYICLRDGDDSDPESTVLYSIDPTSELSSERASFESTMRLRMSSVFYENASPDS